MSFDTFSLATSNHGVTPAVFQNPAYVQSLVAQVESLRVALAEETAKTRKLQEQIALLEASAQPISATSISLASAKSDAVEVRALNKKLQHLHPEVLRVQRGIIRTTSQFMLLRDAWADRIDLLQDVSPEAQRVISGCSPGRRPGWLLGTDKLSIAHVLYKAHVALDFKAIMPTEMAQMLDEHPDDTLEMFKFYVAQARYDLVSKCTNQRHSIFAYLDLTHDIFLREPTYRRTSPQVSYLLGRPAGSKRISAQPPLIYGHLEGEIAPNSLGFPFACEAIEKVLQCMLYGERSLDLPATSWPKSGCIAYKWQVSSVTPAMIAYAAIIVIYLLSGDAELSATGDWSGFNYEVEYMVFAGSLWAGWNKGPVARLVDHLDSKLCKHLPNHPSNKAPDHTAATTGSSISETRNLLADMQEVSSDSDVEVTAGFNSPASSPPPSPVPEVTIHPSGLSTPTPAPLSSIMQEADAPVVLPGIDAYVEVASDPKVDSIEKEISVTAGRRRTSTVSVEQADAPAAKQLKGKGTTKGGRKGKKGASGSSGTDGGATAAVAMQEGTSKATVPARATRSKAARG
ncbi:hypothetical protein FB107DRAFT_249682 [Schizophyllum commune]